MRRIDSENRVRNTDDRIDWSNHVDSGFDQLELKHASVGKYSQGHAWKAIGGLNPYPGELCGHFEHNLADGDAGFHPDSGNVG